MNPERMPTPAQEEQFQRKLTREIHRQQRRKRRRLRARLRQEQGHKFLRTAVSVAVFLFAGTFTLLYNTVETFAASVDNFFSIVTPEAQELRIMEKRDQGFDLNPADFEGMYIPEWVPEGYNVAEIDILDGLKRICYKNADGNQINYYIFIGASSISIDNENIVNTTHYIHGVPAQVNIKDEKIRIVWEDSIYAYMIIGNYDVQNELIEMAEKTMKIVGE